MRTDEIMAAVTDPRLRERQWQQFLDGKRAAFRSEYGPFLLEWKPSLSDWRLFLRVPMPGAQDRVVSRVFNNFDALVSVADGVVTNGPTITAFWAGAPHT